MPITIVFTKSDKIKPNVVNKNIAIYQNKLLETWEYLPDIYVTSSEKKQGTDEILNFIENTNLILSKNKVTFDKY